MGNAPESVPRAGLSPILAFLRPINHQDMAGLLLLYQDYDHNYGLYISSSGGLNPIIIYIYNIIIHI